MDSGPIQTAGIINEGKKEQKKEERSGYIYILHVILHINHNHSTKPNYTSYIVICVLHRVKFKLYYCKYLIKTECLLPSPAFFSPSSLRDYQGLREYLLSFNTSDVFKKVNWSWTLVPDTGAGHRNREPELKLGLELEPREGVHLDSLFMMWFMLRSPLA